MAWSDWVSVLVDVANVAERIFGLLGTDSPKKAGADEVFTLGDLEFKPTVIEGRVYMACRNVGDQEVPLAFAPPSDNPKGPGVLMSIPADRQDWDVTDTLLTYIGGSVTVGNPRAVEKAMRASNPASFTSAVSFAIRAVSVGTVVSLVNGVKFVYERTPTGGVSVSLTSTGRPFQTLRALLTLRDGDRTVNVQGEATFSGQATGEDQTLLTWEIPSSVLLVDDSLDEVNIQLWVPTVERKALQPAKIPVVAR